MFNIYTNYIFNIIKTILLIAAAAVIAITLSSCKSDNPPASEGNSAVNFSPGKTNDNVIYASEKESDEKIFYLESDTIKITDKNCFLKFSYYDKSQWKEFYSTIIAPGAEEIKAIEGSSKDFFHVVTLDNQYNYHLKMWDGTYFKADGLYFNHEKRELPPKVSLEK